MSGVPHNSATVTQRSWTLTTIDCRLCKDRDLEIPIQVTVTMEYSTRNNDAMDEPMVTDKSVAANDSSVV